MDRKCSTVADRNKFYAQGNLNTYIWYYNEHKRLVSNQVVEISRELEAGGLDPNRKKHLELAKQVYLSSYHQHMIINAFLMMYSHFEECLAVTLRIFVKGSLPSGTTGLERFKDEFRNRYSVSLTKGPHWPFLQDCSQVRHALLHAAGNITLVRNRRKKLDPAIKRNSKYVDVGDNRIVLREQMLVKFSNVIPDFLDWLTDEVTRQHNNRVEAQLDRGRSS